MATEKWLDWARRRASVVSFLPLLALGCLACGPEPETVRLEVYAWWSHPSEQSAFDRVIGIHQGRYPNVLVENSGDESSISQRSNVIGRVLSGAPPATFQANLGAALLRWTVVDAQESDVPSTNRLEALGRFFGERGLASKFSPDLLSGLGFGEGSDFQPYAVPINIHRANLIYYNVERLREFERVNGGRSLLDFSTLCPEDGSPDTLEYSIAIGTSQAWTIQLLAWENVLLAIAGPDFYEQFFQGEVPEAGPERETWVATLRRVLECVQRLSAHVHGGASTNSWHSAVVALRPPAGPPATFTVMGDWATPLVEAELREDIVGMAPFPGTEGLFVYTADTFPLPIGVKHREEVVELLDTIASRETQAAFSARKGSIPARIDADLGEFGEEFARRRAEFESSQRVLANSGLFPPTYPENNLGVRLEDMASNPGDSSKVDEVVEFLLDAAPILRSWRTRLAEGPSPPFTP